MCMYADLVYILCVYILIYIYMHIYFYECIHIHVYMYAPLLCGYAVSAYLLYARQLVWSVRARSSGVGVLASSSVYGVASSSVCVAYTYHMAIWRYDLWHMTHITYIYDTYHTYIYYDVWHISHGVGVHTICTPAGIWYVHYYITCSGVSVHSKRALVCTLEAEEHGLHCICTLTKKKKKRLRQSSRTTDPVFWMTRHVSALFTNIPPKKK